MRLRAVVAVTVALLSGMVAGCSSSGWLRPRALTIRVENQLDGAPLDVAITESSSTVTVLHVASGSSATARLTTVTASGADGDPLWLVAPSEGATRYRIKSGFTGPLTGTLSVVINGVSDTDMLEGVVDDQTGAASSGRTGLYPEKY